MNSPFQIRYFRRITLLVAIFLSSVLFTDIIAQDVTNEFKYRSSAGIQLKPVKKLRLSIVPEMRYNSDFSRDKFLIESTLGYKLFKPIKLEGIYRYSVNFREVKSTQYINRYGINATYLYKWRRFEPSFRLTFTNDADDDYISRFLRYKTKIGYNIPLNKLTPYVAFELFHQLDDEPLYKMRYTVGVGYKISKNQRIKLSYKLDEYLFEYRNRHILSVDYIYRIKL